MLEVPPVPDLSAKGLANTAKRAFNDAGLDDSQLEGIGWDGEYVRKGVKGELLDILQLEGWNKEEKEAWITQVWEPAHQLELATKDVKENVLFEWFQNHIQVIEDVAGVLGIGKGLEQSMQAAEEEGEKFYKLKSLSGTRFSAYFEGTIRNFERRMATTIGALRKRTESTDKKVREKAASLLKRIWNKQFFMTNLGLLDIYHLLGGVSKELQTVQLFPWKIPVLQSKLLVSLKKMETLKLSLNDETEELEAIDQSVWKNLGEKIGDILEDKYVEAQAPLFAPGD